MIDAAALLKGLADALERDESLASRLRTLLMPGKADPAVPVYLAPTAFAKHLGVSKRQVFHWLRNGLPSVGSGRARRIPVALAEKWLSSGTARASRVEQAARAAAHRAAGEAR